MAESSTKRSTSEMNHCDDDIDLVDLVIALWRRKWVVIGVALPVFVAALAYALVKQPQGAAPRYTSIYALPAVVVSSSGNAVASGGWLPLVSPQEVIELARLVFVPEAQKSLGLNQAVHIENPEKTNLLVLSSQAPESARQMVLSLHKKVIAGIDAEIQARIDSIKPIPDAAHNSVAKVGGGAQNLYVDRGHVVALGKEQAPVKSKTPLIIVLGAALGLLAGIFVALAAGFFGSVRERLLSHRSQQ